MIAQLVGSPPCWYPEFHWLSPVVRLVEYRPPLPLSLLLLSAGSAPLWPRANEVEDIVEFSLLEHTDEQGCVVMRVVLVPGNSRAMGELDLGQVVFAPWFRDRRGGEAALKSAVGYLFERSMGPHAWRRCSVRCGA